MKEKKKEIIEEVKLFGKKFSLLREAPAPAIEGTESLRALLTGWEQKTAKLETRSKPIYASASAFAEDLVASLSELSKRNPALMMSSDAFFDLIGNWSVVRVQSVLLLLTKLVANETSLAGEEIRLIMSALNDFGTRELLLGI